MLSNDTVIFLNTGCEQSNTLYSEGGLIYTYTYGYHRAHSFFDNNLIKKAINLRSFDNEDVNKINSFFESALLQPNNPSISVPTKEYVQQFIAFLANDFSNMHNFISHYFEDSDSKEMTLSFIHDNDFHSLELFWSID